jgi:hypothetical protein
MPVASATRSSTEPGGTEQWFDISGTGWASGGSGACGGEGSATGGDGATATFVSMDACGAGS